MSGNFSPIFEAFKARRLALRLSQEAVADRVGVSQAYLSKIEKGRIEPRLHTIEDLARALNLELMLVPFELSATVKSILGGSEQPKPLFSAEPD